MLKYFQFQRQHNELLALSCELARSLGRFFINRTGEKIDLALILNFLCLCTIFAQTERKDVRSCFCEGKLGL